MSMKILAAIKICLISVIIPKYYCDWNKLGVEKMEYKTSGVVIEEFAELNPKMYLLFVDDNSERKKVKGRE